MTADAGNGSRSRTAALLLVMMTGGGCGGTSPEPAGQPVAGAASADTPLPVATASEQPLRSFSPPVLRSRESPAIAIEIDPSFTYIGHTEFVLLDKAQVDRYHFVDVDGDRVERMIVIHFERFLDGVDATYRFGIPERLSGGNYRMTPEPVRLGEADYRHNTWAFRMQDSVAERSRGESAHTLALLERNGLTIDDELIMSRFGRAVGDDARHEILLFYFEPLAAAGLSLDELPEESEMSERFDQLSSELTRRSLSAMRIVDG